MNQMGYMRGLWSRGRENKDFIVEMSLQLMIDGLINVYQVAFEKDMAGRLSSVSKNTEK